MDQLTQDILFIIFDGLPIKLLMSMKHLSKTLNINIIEYQSLYTKYTNVTDKYTRSTAV
jgi:hypothetical protein